MTFSEILTLAKAGYKIKDINDLAEKEKQEQTNVGQMNEVDQPVDKKEVKENKSNVGQEKEVNENDTQSAEIEELKRQINELQSRLSKAQEKNVAADISDVKKANIEDELSNMFREYM